MMALIITSWRFYCVVSPFKAARQNSHKTMLNFTLWFVCGIICLIPHILNQILPDVFRLRPHAADSLCPLYFLQGGPIYSAYAIMTLSFNTVAHVAVIALVTATYWNISRSGKNLNYGNQQAKKRKRVKAIERVTMQTILASLLNWAPLFIISMLDFHGIKLSKLAWLCICLFVLPLFSIINPCAYH